MITIIKDKEKQTNKNNTIQILFGLSTDTKPTTNITNGSQFFEMDTSKVYLFDIENNEWHEFVS